MTKGHRYLMDLAEMRDFGRRTRAARAEVVSKSFATKDVLERLDRFDEEDRRALERRRLSHPPVDLGEES